MALSYKKKLELEAQLLENEQTEKNVNKMTEFEESVKRHSMGKFWKQYACELQFSKTLDEEREQKLEKDKLKEEEKQTIAREAEELRKRITEEKLRQSIRQTSHELRELELKLRAAYVAKSQAAQIAENQAARLQKRLDDRINSNNPSENSLLLGSMGEENIQKLREEKLKHRCDLLAQLEDKQLQKKKLFEEFLLDKKCLDCIVERMNEEEMEKLQRKMEQTNQERCDMRKFATERKERLERERLEREAEFQRIMDFIRDEDRKEQKRKDDEAAKKRLTANLSERIGQEIYEREKKALQREELIIQMQAAEIDEKSELRHREELETEFRKRLQNRLMLDQQNYENALRAVQSGEDDKEYQRCQLLYLAERDRIEQLTNEKKRLRMREHRREVQELLEQRRAERERAALEIYEQHGDENQEEKHKQKIIEEERTKLLKEHAKNLIGFLPRGVLRESDKQYLNYC